MPLKFYDLCTLLSELESYRLRDVPLHPNALRNRIQDRIRQWFLGRKISVASTEVDAVALLSALFPKKRTDRVYSLKAPSLSRRLRGCLCLGAGRWQLLDEWRMPGRGDLGDCVERALKQSEFPTQLPENVVMLEQVDAALGKLAAKNRFSGPDVRETKKNDDPREVDQILEQIYRRLQSREAKWFTRILLKDLGSLDIPLTMVLAYLHPELPQYIKVYDTFGAAISMIQTRNVIDSPVQTHTNKAEPHLNITGILTPKVGVKVGRVKYTPGRSVKHAVRMIGRRRISVERKYDGEYCQVHIDRSAGENWIKIFSKSGKDSTVDRAGIHEFIRKCLRLDQEDCGFSGRCILEGELVVWSDRERSILDFCKIRKHVSRSGSYLGTTFDSQPHDFEHLMIIFYDVMLIDDNPILNSSHIRRRRLLKNIITPVPGRAGLAVRDIIDFSSRNGPGQLQQALARAFAMRWEGLVLKPCDEPYFSTSKPSFGEHPPSWIKMKKDYIKGLGDTADFAVVGAGYDAAEARNFGGLKLKWTHFHLGCLTNKGEVINQGAKPKFAVIDALNLCIKPQDVKTLNQLGQFNTVEVGSWAEAAALGMNLEPGVPNLAVAFKEPFVFEVMGAGFDKKPNRTTLSLRFPRVLKIHRDRNWKEAVTMEELQDMASAAKLVPSDDLDKDVELWVGQLKKVDRGAKGFMAPWENSQDDELESNGAGADQSAGNARRGRSKSDAPPMIRMDTGEMSLSEYRLDGGEVLRRPTSKQPETSFAAGSPLPTPPTSSPFRAARNTVADKRPTSNSAPASVQDPGKRNVAETESVEVTSSDEATQFKRARRFFRAQTENNRSGKRKLLQTDSGEVTSSDEATQFKRARRFFRTQQRDGQASHLDSSSLGTSSRVLRNLSNYAQPRQTPAIKAARRRSGRSASPKMFLVRKIPVGISEDVRRRPRPVVGPASPGRDSTVSKATSQDTSQQTVTPGTSARPLPRTKETSPSPNSKKPQLSRTASTIQPPSTSHKVRTSSMTASNSPASSPPSIPTPTATTSPNISLPNLHTARILISPCIANTPYITEDLLASRNFAASPLSQTPTLPNPTPPSLTRRTGDHTIPTILFIESKRKDPTVEVLKDLARQIRNWPKETRRVEVWDWRVLELVTNTGDAGVLDTARDAFYGRMRWDDGEEEIVVRWRDGGLSRGSLPDE